MYPDWPESAADLVPLPLCDGPKLKAFDFQGPQKIEFLEYLGGGAHSHVCKIEIHGQVYALKLFRWLHDDGLWLGPDAMCDPMQTDPAIKDLKIMTPFYNHADPFSCECRAFGRLQETGNTDLAIKCFGYVLLDEKHEQLLWDKLGRWIGHPIWSFDGDVW